MNHLPSAVLNILMQRVLQETSATWLFIDASGLLIDKGGALARFGLNNIEIGCVVQDQAVFLEGILSIYKPPSNIDSVQIDNGEYADIYLVEDHTKRWIILLGRTESSRWKGIAQQKTNELRLLKKKETNTNSDKNKIDFSSLLGILALEKNNNDSFKILEPIPGCSGAIYPETAVHYDNLHPEEDFPFLAHFLEICQDIWSSSEEKRLKSGPWIEVNTKGEEYILEATALLWHQRKILLIERLQDHYQEHLAVLQHARENVLIKQKLEQEIQHQKILEQNLIEARIQADSANRAKSEFLSSMSHELRTPLNSILGFSQLLINDPDAPLTKDQYESMGYILHSGTHLLELIRQILELSKIEAGKIELVMEDIVPKKAITASLQIVQVLADKKNISIKYIQKTDAVISADQMRLNQVIINLLSNAIKYNRHAGSIVIQESITNTGRFKLLIKDTGIGIPKDKQDELFTTFARLGQERLSIEEGSGLGLVITKNIVEAMQGIIGFDSIELILSGCYP